MPAHAGTQSAIFLAHCYIAFAKYRMGRAAETEAHSREALRLSPRDVFQYRWMNVVGQARLQIGADSEALGWMTKY